MAAVTERAKAKQLAKGVAAWEFVEAMALQQRQVERERRLSKRRKTNPTKIYNAPARNSAGIVVGLDKWKKSNRSRKDKRVRCETIASNSVPSIPSIPSPGHANPAVPSSDHANEPLPVLGHANPPTPGHASQSLPVPGHIDLDYDCDNMDNDCRSETVTSSNAKTPGKLPSLSLVNDESAGNIKIGAEKYGELKQAESTYDVKPNITNMRSCSEDIYQVVKSDIIDA